LRSAEDDLCVTRAGHNGHDAMKARSFGSCSDCENSSVSKQSIENETSCASSAQVALHDERALQAERRTSTARSHQNSKETETERAAQPTNRQRTLNSHSLQSIRSCTTKRTMKSDRRTPFKQQGTPARSHQNSKESEPEPATQQANRHRALDTTDAHERGNGGRPTYLG
jgi:hypothetical protein